jgi:adenylate cyclase
MIPDKHMIEALREVRLENARFINRIRAAGVGAFTILSLLMAFVFKDDSWETPVIWLAPYFVIALVLMIGATVNPKILWLSRFAIPVLDIPLVAGMQLVSVWWEIESSGTPGNISEFSVSLFVCMLMLSALTLNTSQIWMSLISVIVAEQIIQHEAGIEFNSTIPGVLIFVLAAWICLVAGKKRLRLVTLLSQGETKRRRLQRYFSPGVGELLEQQSGGDLELGQDYEVTVIFTDIREFTAMSEGMTSREVVTLLNTCHARMVDAVFRHGGTLDKYMGDGLMAYFNAPVGQADHAERAFKCAMEMRQGLADLNTERSWNGSKELRMGIGIHTGQAIVGDIGAPHRREFTAIGDAVNVTARIEELTKEIGHEVLISETTATLLPEGGLLTDVGVQSLRGSSQPLRLFTPGNKDCGSEEEVEKSDDGGSDEC